MGRQEECLPRSFFGNPFHLVENSTWSDDRYPILGRAFSFSHPGFSRFLGDGFIREDPNPDSAGPLDESGHGNSCRFDLPSGQPTTLCGLKPEIPEVEGIAPGGHAPPSAFLHLSIFGLFGHQHNDHPEQKWQITADVRFEAEVKVER